MQDDTFRVKFWGVRGSLPVSGEQFLHYGGNTPCIEIRCGKEVLIFDAGSGLREAGLSLMSEGVSEFDVFFTHTHYDHIIGLPYFKPIYRCSSAVRFWSGHLHGTMSTAEMINEFMRPPWFPVGTGICQASLDTVDFRPGETLSPRKDVSIRTMSLVHPGDASATVSNGAGGRSRSSTTRNTNPAFSTPCSSISSPEPIS